MIRKKVKHIYFKSFIDNADIINTHNYFTSYSEFFNKLNNYYANCFQNNLQNIFSKSGHNIEDVVLFK